MKIIKTANYIKIAQVQNPLDGKSNQSAINFVYKLVAPFTKGIYSDSYWEGIQKIWKTFDENGIEHGLTRNPQYFKDEAGNPNKKEWYFQISFTNNRGRPTILQGTLTAFGAGTVEDPLSRYDITMQLWRSQ